MKYFKIKHKLTGLYYRPMKGKRSNLDSTGKIYSTNSMYNCLIQAEGISWPVSYICFTASKGKSKTKVPIEYEIGMKIHNREFPGITEGKIKYDRTDEHYDYVDIGLYSRPEDWEKEYVEINVTNTDE